MPWGFDKRRGMLWNGRMNLASSFVKGRICCWDHRALARDLEFGPGLRCLRVRAAHVRES